MPKNAALKLIFDVCKTLFVKDIKSSSHLWCSTAFSKEIWHPGV